MVDRTQDIDSAETREWLEALESVLRIEGVQRGHYLIERLIDKARRSGVHLPYSASTAYVNTIHASEDKEMPGEPGLEHRIRSIIRWNALAMVVQANRQSSELGGHIASFASAATLYDVGFNHFFRGPDHESGGDLIYVQGHSSPGIYARAFLEGRLSEEQLQGFPMLGGSLQAQWREYQSLRSQINQRTLLRHQNRLPHLKQLVWTVFQVREIP